MTDLSEISYHVHCLTVFSLQAHILETSTSILFQYTTVLTYIGHCLVFLNYSDEEKIDCITLFNLETGMVGIVFYKLKCTVHIEKRLLDVIFIKITESLECRYLHESAQN